MKNLVTKVSLNDMIIVEDLGTSGIIREQKKMATASDNNGAEMY